MKVDLSGDRAIFCLRRDAGRCASYRLVAVRGLMIVRRRAALMTADAQLLMQEEAGKDGTVEGKGEE